MSVVVCDIDGCRLDPGHEGTHVPWAGFKYATPRNPKHSTDGAKVAMIAAALGKPGMPWQREVWDVALERDAFGRFVYETIIVTVPRQSGKTTLYGPVQIERAITNPGIKTFYTAQTGKDARARYQDLVALVQGSALDALAHFRYSQGDEGIGWPNGSVNKIFAPVKGALHGETPPLVGLDEIWEFEHALGKALLDDAIIPAQSTLTGRRQRWLFSTFGTDESEFLWEQVAIGRQSVLEPGSHPRVAYFEAGLREGADPYDPREIASFHPAVGYTVTVGDLLVIAGGKDGAGGVSLATWLRAFCNVRTSVADPLFSTEHVDALAEDPIQQPRLRDVTISWALGDNGTHGVVAASWEDLDGRPVTRVLHSAPGSIWMHDFIVDLARTWKPKALGAAASGPKRVTDKVRLTLGDDAVTTLAGPDFATACDSWLDHVGTNTFKHDGTKAITSGVQHLVVKSTNDGPKVFDRTSSSGSIAGPESSAVGQWLAEHTERIPSAEDYLIHV